MAKLYFRYGAMKSGKSIDLIKTKINYEISDRQAIVLKSSIDTRDGESIKTRLGKSEDAILLKGEKGEIIEIFHDYVNRGLKISALLIDEAQFLNEEQVMELTKIVDFYDTSVICWGLKTNFKGELFNGSKLLIEYSDKIEEIKTVCQFCESKAIMNMRVRKDKNGILRKADKNEKEILIGDDEYIQVCRKHFLY